MEGEVLQNAIYTYIFISEYWEKWLIEINFTYRVLVYFANLKRPIIITTLFIKYLAIFTSSSIALSHKLIDNMQWSLFFVKNWVNLYIYYSFYTFQHILVNYRISRLQIKEPRQRPLKKVRLVVLGKKIVSVRCKI